MAERNADVPADQRIELRIGINLGDVVVGEDGDLMGDGFNIAAASKASPSWAVSVCPKMLTDTCAEKWTRPSLTWANRGSSTLPNPSASTLFYPQVQSTALHDLPPEKSGPPRLSIMVHSFANIGGDPEQKYFVDGVTESLTTDLSRTVGIPCLLSVGLLRRSMRRPRQRHLGHNQEPQSHTHSGQKVVVLVSREAL
jgi:hypothetical protein